MNKTMEIVKFNLKYSKLTYFIVIGLYLAECIDFTINILIGSDDIFNPSQLLMLGFILFPIFIPTTKMKKLIAVGASKIEYLKATFISIVIYAFVTAILVSTIYMIELAIIGNPEDLFLVSMFNVFEYDTNIFRLFLYVFILGTLVMSFINLLAFSNRFIYGWILDVIIVAVLSVFIPIAPLREILVWFLELTAINSNLLVMFIVDLFLVVIMHLLTIPLIKKLNV